ncbi:MAG: DUF448 domain-containing protein [Polyangiaceae bacterium]
MTDPRTPPSPTQAAPEEGAKDAARPESGRAGSERTCVGCGERAEPGEMVRLVLGPGGEVAVDAAGGGFGRGAHVHARAACLAQAAARGLMRATKGKAASVSLAVREGGEVSAGEASALSAAALGKAVEEAMSRRIVGLLTTAARTRAARIGADAASAAWRAGEAELVVVSTDAAAAAELSAVREAVSEGAAVAWGTRETLAAALMRRPSEAGVAVVAITSAGIADAVRDAVEKTMGARGAEQASARGKGGASARPTRGGKVATRGAFRGKVAPDRAGRASGRQLRRAQESRQ